MWEGAAAANEREQREGEGRERVRAGGGGWGLHRFGVFDPPDSNRCASGV